MCLWQSDLYPPRLPRQEVTEKPTSSRSHRLAQETAGSEANNLKGEVEANEAEVDENGLPQIPEESETKMMVEELKAEIANLRDMQVHRREEAAIREAWEINRMQVFVLHNPC